jgi:hypothetical protein
VWKKSTSLCARVKNRSTHNDKKEEAQLVSLLKQLYGDAWQFEWQGEDDGFSLIIEVNQPKEQPCT